MLYESSLAAHKQLQQITYTLKHRYLPCKNILTWETQFLAIAYVNHSPVPLQLAYPPTQCSINTASLSWELLLLLLLLPHNHSPLTHGTMCWHTHQLNVASILPHYHNPSHPWHYVLAYPPAPCSIKTHKHNTQESGLLNTNPQHSNSNINTHFTSIAIQKLAPKMILGTAHREINHANQKGLGSHD